MSPSKSRFLSDYLIVDKLLDECYRDPNFSVKRMSTKLGISVSYLRELVTCRFEINPHKLIENYRLTKSLELLENDMKEYDIINRIGYSSTRTFRRAFKNRLNMLPIQYKTLKNTTIAETKKFHQECINKLWPSKLLHYYYYCIMVILSGDFILLYLTLIKI